MAGDRHDLRALRALFVQALELIHRPPEHGVRALTLKHQDEIVQLEVVRQRHHRRRGGAKRHRLIVQHPVADVLDPGRCQVIERVVGMGKARPPPSSRPVSRECGDQINGSLDGLRLILDPVHRDVLVAVRGQFPAAGEAGRHHLRIAVADFGVDGDGRRDAEPLEHPVEAPEADAHPVLMPAPIGDIGDQRRTLRRRNHGPRHRSRDVPFLERENRPEHQARPAGQRQRRPLGDGRERQSVSGLHVRVSPFARLPIWTIAVRAADYPLPHRQRDRSAVSPIGVYVEEEGEGHWPSRPVARLLCRHQGPFRATIR